MRFFACLLLALAPLTAMADPDGIVQLPYVYREAPSDVRIKALPWHVADLDMPRHWKHTGAGKGTRWAIVDTGLDADHPEFKGKKIVGKNFVGRRTENWSDDNDHGSHVVGIGAGLNVGMAPACDDLIIAKVLRANGSGPNSAVSAGIKWAARQEPPPNVMNISLGGAIDDPETRDAVYFAKQRGCLVFIATGNEGASEVGYPAQHGVGIGAVDRARVLAYFSNKGKFCDAVGSGVNVYSSIPGGRYAEFSGTSMATPFICGIALNRLSAELKHTGRITTNTDEELLKLENFTNDLGEPGRDPSYGRGFPDCDRLFYEGLTTVTPPTDPNCELPPTITVLIGGKQAEYQLSP